MHNLYLSFVDVIFFNLGKINYCIFIQMVTTVI